MTTTTQTAASIRSLIAAYSALYSAMAPRSSGRRQCRELIASLRHSLRAERKSARVERETAGFVRMARAIVAK